MRNIVSLIPMSVHTRALGVVAVPALVGLCEAWSLMVSSQVWLEGRGPGEVALALVKKC